MSQLPDNNVDGGGIADSGAGGASPAESAAMRRRMEYDVIEPVGWRVVIRKDDNRRQTRSGIVLPDSKEIPVITGRIVAVSREVENDEDVTIHVYDKVLFDPREAIPVELEHDNKLFVVGVDSVLAIFRRSAADAERAARESAGKQPPGTEGPDLDPEEDDVDDEDIPY